MLIPMVQMKRCNTPIDVVEIMLRIITQTIRRTAPQTISRIRIPKLLVPVSIVENRVPNSAQIHISDVQGLLGVVVSKFGQAVENLLFVCFPPCGLISPAVDVEDEEGFGGRWG